MCQGAARPAPVMTAPVLSTGVNHHMVMTSLVRCRSPASLPCIPNSFPVLYPALPPPAPPPNDTPAPPLTLLGFTTKMVLCLCQGAARPAPVMTAPVLSAGADSRNLSASVTPTAAAAAETSRATTNLQQQTLLVAVVAQYPPPHTHTHIHSWAHTHWWCLTALLPHGPTLLKAPSIVC